MTGFESWVKMGLELGADLLLETAAEIAEESDYPLSSEEMSKRVAARFMDRWPPWKVERLQQTSLPFDCDLCGRDVPFSETRTTAHGRVCLQCLGSIIKRAP